MKRSHWISSVAAAGLVWLACASRLSAQNNLIVTPTTLTFNSQSLAPQSISIQSSGAQLQFSVSTATPWIAVVPQGVVTPSTAQVFVSDIGLQPGTHTGTISITAAGAANSPVTVQVIFNIAISSQLTASPTSLAFDYVTGGTAPASKFVTVGTMSGVSLTFNATATSSGNWLIVNPPSATAPNATLTVSVDSTVVRSLAVGTYNGEITLTPTGGVSGVLRIPVSLTVRGAPALTVTPASLSFYYQLGAAAPAQQLLRVETPGAQLIAFTLTKSAPSDWLVVSPTGGATPADIFVGVNPSVLPALNEGVYNATITITAPGATDSPKTVQVSLTVSRNPLLTASPSSLSFEVQPGGSLPASKTFTLSSSSPSMPITISQISTTTEIGINWLRATWSSLTTPVTVTVEILPAALTLAPGAYRGTVVITSGAANAVLNVPVSLAVSDVPLLSPYPNSLSFNYQTTKPAPVPQMIEVTSTGAPIEFTAAVTSGSWLSVTQTSAITPATLVVSVNPTGLASNNTYQGTITLTPRANPAAAQTLNVRFRISDTPLVWVTPNALSFRFEAGATTGSQQRLTVNSTSITDPLTFTFSSEDGGRGWLFVSAQLGTVTPSELLVTVIPSALQPGIYRGSVTVSVAGANSETIPVTLTVTTGNRLSVTPASLTFTQAQGGAAPASQTLQVSTSGASVSFSATPASTPTAWLSVSPPNATTPGAVTVSVNAGSLTPGTYNGSITIAASGVANSPQTIPVYLTVTSPQTISLNPASLTFNHQIGSSAPAVQRLQVTSSGSALSFTATAATASGGNWLSVSPGGGNTPGELTVSVNPSGLTAGVYNGTIRIEAAGASNSPQTATVTLNVTAPAAPQPTVVANAASYVSGPIAPGEIITIGGTNLGPATAVGLRLTAAGLVDTNIGDTRVLFDNIPAPLIYVSRTQINAVVPYEIWGRVTTRLQVEYQGVRSEALTLAVAETAPGIFAADASGRGQGAILNEDRSLNGPSNPADRGSVIMIYGTGEGQTDPPGLTGSVTGSLLRRPRRDVAVLIGGRPAEVQYAGSAPGFVAGALQVNAVVPADVQPGPAVPVVLVIGGNASPSTITLAVR